ncbi:MAG: hypothetical protein Q4D61_03155 [Cardiobacteriaceae bacterium]|nr:hypothetical protein [Cardiobacteriaceae bacterium]
MVKDVEKGAGKLTKGLPYRKAGETGAIGRNEKISHHEALVMRNFLMQSAS